VRCSHNETGSGGIHLSDAPITDADAVYRSQSGETSPIETLWAFGGSKGISQALSTPCRAVSSHGKRGLSCLWGSTMEVRRGCCGSSEEQVSKFDVTQHSLNFPKSEERKKSTENHEIAKEQLVHA
jgi:hypothetical protein